MGDHLLEGFRAAAEAAASEVHVVDGPAAAAALVGGWVDGGALAVAASMSEDPLVTALGDSGVAIRIPGARDPVADVADTGVGVVRAERAIAETGSVLVSEHDLADRVVTMLCTRLVAVVDVAVLVEGLDEVADWLGARAGDAGFASLITGPSRTADIERSLTIGVQGPDRVDVVVIV